MKLMQKFLSFFKDLRHHKRRLLFIVIPIIILGFIFWPKPPKPIETQAVKRQDIVESLSATGTVDATSVNLNFLTSGKLVYLAVKKGDTVTAGETIATLDQRSVQDNLENSLRDYDKQRNTFDQTKIDNKDKVLNDDLRRVLANNQYDLDKAVISVDLQNLAKEQSVLTSPIKGVVTKVGAETTGVNLDPTDTFTVVDLSDATFNIDIDESDVGQVKVGQQVKITLDAYPDDTITVPVKAIDYASHTTSTGSTVYTVEVMLPNTSKFNYRVGMSGDAEIVTDEKKDVLTVPLSSIADDHYVYVQQGSYFEKRNVKLGLQNDTDTEVISGVNEGEQVAIDPTEAENRVKK